LLDVGGTSRGATDGGEEFDELAGRGPVAIEPEDDSSALVDGDATGGDTVEGWAVAALP
jgi:hypothetical protein